MCTALTFGTDNHYFGRNLDLEYGYQEAVTITPRNYPILPKNQPHYAMIGMATVMDGYPLYYEATNEKGLSMAALNFPGNAVYLPPSDHKINVSPFQLIPWILGQCSNLIEAKKLLRQINAVDRAFRCDLPLTPLHWLIADPSGSSVVEPMADGLRLFDNPFGVLTNNPPFDYHLHHICQYLNCSPTPAENCFCPQVELKPFSRGMGGLGLPGDFSSPSRFVKAAFVKLNSPVGDTENSRVNQFFHILSTVAMPRGSVQMADGRHEITRYSCCCNTDTAIYYYKTYENSRIHGVSLFHEDLDSPQVVTYPLLMQEPFSMQN